MEVNILKGLNDWPTMTKLAVLVLYCEAISVKYISTVCGKRNEPVNALKMGPFYEKVKTHLKTLINDSLIILAPDADPRKATLGGLEEWISADCVSAIHSYKPNLPYLEAIFKAFLLGTLETWERFSVEFNGAGIIAGLTGKECELAWMPATNDINEGALGALRVYMQKSLGGSLHRFNSLYRFRRNGMDKFRDTLLTGHDHEAFVRGEARRIEALGTERKRNCEIDEEKDEIVIKRVCKDEERQEKRAKEQQRLNGISIVSVPGSLTDMAMKQLNDQLKKLQQLDKSIASVTSIKKKEGKLTAALTALIQNNLCTVTLFSNNIVSVSWLTYPFRNEDDGRL
ncbi:hypothetical protein ACEPAG_3596 [Sanghuangporus baumii]